MKNDARAIFCCLVVALSIATVDAPRAEVRVESRDGQAYTLILGIIEDPDPMAAIYWEPILGEPGSSVLNPDGDQRNDGRPSIAFLPNTNWPVVVWSYGVGSDTDIAFAEWTGGQWSTIEFLTTSIEHELDPRIFVDESSNVHVVWWEAESQNVWLVSRDAGSEIWSMPELVASGRRPSVAVSGEETLLAFEGNAWGGIQEIVMHSWRGNDPHAEVVVATTERSDPLDPVVHALNGRIWVDWKHGNDVFAYSERIDGIWTMLQLVPWSNDSWVSEEEARAIVQTEVFGE